MIKNNYFYDEKYITIYTNQYTSISLDHRWQEKPEKAIYTHAHIYIYIYTAKYKYIRAFTKRNYLRQICVASDSVTCL